MTISSLTDECYWSPNTSGYRTADISKVTVHHMAGDLSIEACGNIFANPNRQASSNYGVGSDGRIGCYLIEEYHPWTTASYWADDRGITIEVADQDCVNWVPSDEAYRATVELCADICLRYGIEPSYTGGTDGSFLEHRMFAATACPGSWWHSHMDSFVQDVRDEMEDGMVRPADVWEYDYEDTAPGGNMYNCAVGTYDLLTHTPANIWGYNWEDTAPQGNMYNCITGMYAMVEQLTEKVVELTKKVDSISIGGVDAKEIAKAVNDDAAKRMIS